MSVREEKLAAAGYPATSTDEEIAHLEGHEAAA
jgi:hypothetical protein